MKAKSFILYASVALNVALLILVALPRTGGNIALAQVANSVGTYAGVACKGGSDQDALWLANRVAGTMVVYQYRLGAKGNPVEIVGTRNLRDDLEERQIGNLMLLSADIASDNAVVFVIDTDSDKMVIYEYNSPNRTLSGIQKISLADDFAPRAAD